MLQKRRFFDPVENVGRHRTDQRAPAKLRPPGPITDATRSVVRISRWAGARQRLR
jgi:hypothetical protein